MLASILTASYNCKRYLSDCIESVLKQTYTNFEMIIVDDMSTDNTFHRLQKYEKLDSRIKPYNLPKHLGCGGAYNFALSCARGDICCVLDADDALSGKNSLDIIVKKYNEYPYVDYMWTQFYMCNEKLKKNRIGHSSLPNTSFLDAGIKQNKYRHCFSHWRTFRTKLRYLNYNIFNPELHAAVDKWMSYVLEEIGQGGFYNKPLYLYRRRFGGLSYQGKEIWKNFMPKFKEERLKKGIVPFKVIKIK